MRKKGCVFCSSFFGYEKDIIDQISKDYDCKLFNSEPRFSLFDNIIGKINKNHKYKKTYKYIKRIIDSFQNLDFVLIILSPFFTKKLIEYIRIKMPNAQIINYLWDSIKNFPNLHEISKACDITYSFDENDCIKYQYNFLPLFFPEITINSNNEKYDFCSIYSLYPKKIKNYNIINKFLPKDKKEFRHIFVKKIYFYYYKIFFKEFRHVNKGDIKFYPLKKLDVYNIFNESKIIIDCPLSDQSGLTIRTFEALKLKKKIITTNTNIKKYEFYNKKNILVVQDYEIFPSEFLNEEFSIDEQIIKKYSLSSFIGVLLKTIK